MTKCNEIILDRDLIMYRLAFHLEQKVSNKPTGKMVATALGISPMNFRTMKNREVIPFQQIIKYAITQNLDLNYIFSGNSIKHLY